LKTVRQKRERRNLGITVLILLVISIVFGILFDFFCTRIEYITHPKPDEYSGYVTMYSEQYGVPENLIWAVIKTESGFDHYATSDVGAMGLMQLMPSTFEEITNQRLKEGLDPIRRLDPETNIKYGTYYLSYLFTEHSRWKTVLSVYLFDQTTVEAWCSDSDNTDEKGNLLHIPDEEAREAVENAEKTVDLYQDLYYSE